MEVKRIYLLVHPFYEWEAIKQKLNPTMRNYYAPVMDKPTVWAYENLAAKWAAIIEKAEKDPNAIVVLIGLNIPMDFLTPFKKTNFLALNQPYQHLTQKAKKQLKRRLVYFTESLDQELLLKMLDVRSLHVTRNTKGIAFGEYFGNCVHAQADLLRKFLSIRVKEFAGASNPNKEIQERYSQYPLRARRPIPKILRRK